MASGRLGFPINKHHSVGLLESTDESSDDDIFVTTDDKVWRRITRFACLLLTYQQQKNVVACDIIGWKCVYLPVEWIIILQLHSINTNPADIEERPLFIHRRPPQTKSIYEVRAKRIHSPHRKRDIKKLFSEFGLWCVWECFVQIRAKKPWHIVCNKKGFCTLDSFHSNWLVKRLLN